MSARLLIDMILNACKFPYDLKNILQRFEIKLDKNEKYY